MPIYEYECLVCSKTFDVTQKFSDPDVTNCRFCNGEVRRLISPPAIIFKGTGWYATDYAKKENGAEKKAESPPACNTSCKNPCK
ncbi:MAG: zinc ribbon domain-containing protein [Candidatus Schekmanbacteria bacterium]|nr:zinc ribbon domain-containing protein [Candidatus Schekmanbacteria bacterium]